MSGPAGRVQWAVRVHAKLAEHLKRLHPRMTMVCRKMMVQKAERDDCRQFYFSTGAVGGRAVEPGI